MLHIKLVQFAVRCALPPRRSESPVCTNDNKPSCVLHLLDWFIGSRGFSSLERRPEFWVLHREWDRVPRNAQFVKLDLPEDNPEAPVSGRWLETREGMAKQQWALRIPFIWLYLFLENSLPFKPSSNVFFCGSPRWKLNSWKSYSPHPQTCHLYETIHRVVFQVSFICLPHQFLSFSEVIIHFCIPSAWQHGQHTQ